VPLTNDQRFLIFLEAAPDFSAQLCPDATLADLDPSALANFRSRWAAKAGSDRILSLSDERLLVDTELMVDGKLTYAALILFGTRSGLGKHLARSEVVFEYRSSDLPGPAQDRQEYREGFLLFHDAIWNRINLRNDNQSYQDRFFRIDVPTFDEEVTREAILNAVCHREYHLEGSVFVRHAHKRIKLDARDLLVLDLVRRRESVPTRLRSKLEFLRDRGIVESVGRGRGTRYLLSRTFYAQMNESGSYVHPQLDRDRLRELLLECITASGDKGVTIDELQHVASSLSRRHLQRLLAQLRATRQIDMRGSRRGSRWHPPTG